jgi:hypothetical protein
MAGNSGRGAGPAGQTLLSLVPVGLASGAAGREPLPSWMQANSPAEEAAISVWWDYLPGVSDGDSKQPTRR